MHHGHSIDFCDVVLASCIVCYTTGPAWLPVLNSTLTDVTHSGGVVVLQVTLAAGVELSTLSAFTVTVDNRN